jgi:hypothetical protein
MLARGYDGEVRSLPLPAVPARQLALLAVGLVLLALLALASSLL